MRRVGLFFADRRGGDNPQQRDCHRNAAADKHLLHWRDWQQGNVALHDAENGQQQGEPDGAGF